MIQLGLDELGVSDLGAVGAVGGQKAVRKVSDGTRDLVMKVIALTPSAPDALRRAEREVDLLAKLTSPHVVRVESTLRELGEPAVAAAWLEEYLDGEDLTARLGTPWSWDDTSQLGFQQQQCAPSLRRHLQGSRLWVREAYAAVRHHCGRPAGDSRLLEPRAPE